MCRICKGAGVFSFMLLVIVNVNLRRLIDVLMLSKKYKESLSDLLTEKTYP